MCVCADILVTLSLSLPNEFGDGTMKWAPSVQMCDGWMDGWRMDALNISLKHHGKMGIPLAATA